VTRPVAAWIMLGLAGCPGSGPNREPPSNTAKEEAPVSGAKSPSGEPHPGQIVYEDRVEKRTWTRNAAEVPPTIAWVKVAEHWKPVVRIEIDGMGDQREITKFGPDREFLEVTSARMGPPPPAPSEPEPVPVPVPTPAPERK
jgi:hypothetical protein